MDDQRTHSIQHDSADGRWDLVTCAPSPALVGLVRRYQGYIEQSTSLARQLELPHPNVVLVINLGPAIRVVATSKPAGVRDYGSFVAGLYDESVFVEATGPMRCLQVDLTAIGARLIMRQPMDALVNRTVQLSDLFGGAVTLLEEQFDSAPTWADRFDLMDRMILGRLKDEHPVTPGVVWTWQRLQRSAGSISVAGLAEELGWRRKHLVQKFRDEIGMPPKIFARLIRFDRAVRCANRSVVPNWSEIAHSCGYADQSHFNREFRSFAGLTPNEYLRLRTPAVGPLVD